MPQLPQYGPQDVGREPVRSPQLPVDQPLSAFGGGRETAQAFGEAKQAADIASAQSMRTLEDAIQVQTVDGLSRLAAEETRQKQELQKFKGKDAVEASGKALESYDKFGQELERGIQNPVVQQRVAMHRAQYRNSLDSWGKQYATQEFQRWDGERVRSGIENEMNAAVADGSPERVNLAVARQMAFLQDYGRRQGWSPDQMKAEADKTASGTHFGVLESKVASGNDLDAKAYYDSVKDQLVGRDAVRAEHMVQTGSTLGAAQRVVDSVFSRAVDFSQDKRETGPVFGSEKDALEAVRAATEGMGPGVRAKAEDLAYRQYHLEKLADKEAGDNLFTSAAEQLRQSGDLDGIQRSSTWEQLSEQHKRYLEDMAVRFAKSGSPYALKNDPDTVTKFWAMTPEALSEMSRADFEKVVPASAVTEETFKSYAAHWGAVKNKSDAVEFTVKHEDEKKMFELARDAGLAGLRKTSKMDNLGDKAEAYNAIAEEGRSRLRAAAAEKGNKLSQEDRHRIISDLVIERRARASMVPRWFEYVVGQAVTPVTDPERERINATVRRLTGNDATREKIQLLKRAEMMGASVDELKRLAAAE